MNWGRGIPQSEWARQVFRDRWGEDIARQTREERERQGKPARVEVVL